MVHAQTGLDLMDEWARSLVGLPPNCPERRPTALVHGYSNLLAPRGLVLSAPDVDELLAQENVVQGTVNVKEGGVMGELVHSSVRGGRALVALPRRRRRRPGCTPWRPGSPNGSRWPKPLTGPAAQEGTGPETGPVPSGRPGQPVAGRPVIAGSRRKSGAGMASRSSLPLPVRGSSASWR
ncbi:hypothetical protein NKH18_42965 [Streptomyces sp. M10(2022)]